jgi:DNA polymerase (family 10)
MHNSALSRPRIPLARAHVLASTLAREAARAGLPSTLTPIGSLRRFAPEVGDVCLLGVTPPGRQPQLVDDFARLASVTAVLERHPASLTVATARGTATLHVTTPEHAGSALVWHTGSIAHTSQLLVRAKRRGLTFHSGTLKGAGGVLVAASSEDEFYQALELPYIAPELREGDGEIEAAERGALPALVSDLNIRGDLHMHSTWSDGRDSIEEMVQAAQQIGYEYVAITDHSERSPSSRSLARADVATQRQEVDAVRAGAGRIVVLWGIEVDIMRDGSLDFDDETLSGFDIVLASLHDAGGQEPGELTERYLKAMANPYVNLITHPAGRSPGYSSGHDLDFDRLFAAAVATGTAMEIDGAPGHLDMDGTIARRAVAAGVTVAIDSDGHRKDALARQMRFGIGTARRGWVEPQHVLNACGVQVVRDFVARKRGRRRG